MFEADNCFDRFLARSTASLVGKGGGLVERSVIPSWGCRVGDSDLASLIRSVGASLYFLIWDAARSSSVFVLPNVTPDQSPDFGRGLNFVGEADNGVRVPMFHEKMERKSEVERRTQVAISFRRRR